MSIEVSGNLKMTREMAQEKGINFPVLIDDSFYSREKLHVSGTPTTFVIDSDGRIRCRLIGYLPEMRDMIEEVLSRI